VNKIVHFEVTGDSVDDVQKFYEGIFDWKVIDAGMPGMDYRLISTNGGGPEESIGGMYARGGEGSLNQMLVYFGVDSVDETLEKIKSSGGNVMQEKMEIPGIGYMSVVSDPWGNLFALFQGLPQHTGQG
jgi:predicted enzyme related to lactoylglutathione lyase